MRRLLLPALAACLAPALAAAQRAESPVSIAPYIALGGDFGLPDVRDGSPLFASAGLERSRVGSRWSLRLGADYRRQTVRFADTRWEDIGVGLTARYARRSGTIRPYLLGGVGIADLRVRGRWAKYEKVNGSSLVPVDSSLTTSSRWNGALSSGFGSEFALGRLKLFSEARLNFYPARLSDDSRSYQMRTTKALYLGVKF